MAANHSSRHKEPAFPESPLPSLPAPIPTVLTSTALTPAGHVWSVFEYIRYPTHVSELQHQQWAEQRNKALESPLDVYQRKKSLPIS